jgi:VIT1/CCC1 family predicted Fe2+/Mn2+ transporter
MNNVVSINKRRSNERKFLDAYSDAQTKERIPDDAFFVAGVILSMILPEGIYSFYGGIVPLAAFVATALAGTILGVTMYYTAAFSFISYFSKSTVLQSPPSRDTMKKKAA